MVNNYHYKIGSDRGDYGDNESYSGEAMMAQQQLNSETPLRQSDELKRKYEYYHSIFDKYDRNKDGYLNVMELTQLIESREYDYDIPKHVIKRIYQLADKNNDKLIDFNEFVDMINNPNYETIFGHYMIRYIKFIVPPRRYGVGTTVPDGAYDDKYSCYPPPVGMIILSLIIIIFFCIDEAMEMHSTHTASGPVATLFIYDPQQRQEIWRYISYMFVHIGYFHLVVNLFVQIMLGIPLEMIHKWWRVLIIYVAGVLAGSLFTSIVDPTVKLAGASGGVYSLITAHIATIIMNWREMSFPIVQLLIFIVLTASDVGTSIYDRYVLDKNDHIGYAAHFAGALAGLLVGINILKNLKVTRTERVVWWISTITYLSLMTIAIIWNILWTSYFSNNLQ